MARKVDLTEALTSLQEKLREAMHESERSNLSFEFQSVEVELELIIEREPSAQAGLQWLVIEGDRNSSDKQFGRHRLKLKLAGIERSGSAVRISGLDEVWPS